MNSINFLLFLKTAIAHLISDFLLQTKKTATEKNNKGFKSRHLYYHTLITAFILFLIILDLSQWPIVLIIALTHFIIDGSKSFIKKNNEKIWVFFADQIFHFLVIIIVWLTFTGQWGSFMNLTYIILNKINNWWILLGLIFVTFPLSVIIGLLTRKWSDEIKTEKSGLKDAGKWIGIIERVLVFLFVLLNQTGVIGFLLTAKSVFRFGDLTKNQEQKKTEYIIIGTLLSFSTAVFIGLIVKFIIR